MSVAGVVEGFLRPGVWHAKEDWIARVNEGCKRLGLQEARWEAIRKALTRAGAEEIYSISGKGYFGLRPLPVGYAAGAVGHKSPASESVGGIPPEAQGTTPRGVPFFFSGDINEVRNGHVVIQSWKPPPQAQDICFDERRRVIAAPIPIIPDLVLKDREGKITDVFLPALAAWGISTVWAVYAMQDGLQKVTELRLRGQALAPYNSEAARNLLQQADDLENHLGSRPLITRWIAALLNWPRSFHSRRASRLDVPGFMGPE